MTLGTLALVTGTRYDERYGAVSDALAAVDALAFVVVGDACGVDAEAQEWCYQHGVDGTSAWALWKTAEHAAGPRRNEVLVAMAVALVKVYGFRGVCLAVPGPISVGTYDCASKAVDAGLELVKVCPPELWRPPARFKNLRRE